LPLKLSTYPFSHGLPGSMNAVLAPTPLIQARTAVATNSGPLSEPYVARRRRADEQVGQHVDDVRRLEPAPHPNGQALARVLIDHVEHPEPAAVARAVHDEVIRPHVVHPLRPQAQAGAVRHPQPAALGLPRRHLQPLTAPDPLHPLVIAPPALALSRAVIRR
jgi:hypothetical protein